MGAISLNFRSGGERGAVASGASTIRTMLSQLTRPRRSGRLRELQWQTETLLKRMRVAVIYGGDKNAEDAVLFRSHNPRSWKSYKTVAGDIAASLERLGACDVALLPDDMNLCRRLRDLKIDFAWLNTAGVQGSAPMAHAASTLEMLGVPYVGHDPMTAAILDAKHTFKRLMIGAGVPTAAFMTWHGAEGRFAPDSSERFRRTFRDYGGPFIVKPVSGRASLNVEYVESVDDLAVTVSRVIENSTSEVMIEKFLSGREYCVAICGSVIARDRQLVRNDGPFSFAFVERVLEENEHVFTSMDQKPITNDRVRPLDPKKDAVVISELSNLAQRVFFEMELETLVRLDVRADANGNLNVLETNPKPDLKAPTVDGVVSLIAAGLSRCGMSYDDLVLSLFADRVDVLLCKRRNSVNHLLELLHD